MNVRTMQKLVAAMTLTALASSACGMVINPNGSGQVLIFPYYTVNKSQQTFVTVSNPTSSAKSLEVVFREGYDGIPVYVIGIFLAPQQSWTTTVFALSDINQTGNGAASVQNLDVCTEPLFFASNGQTTPGISYALFTDVAYTGSVNDGGPTDDSREREGFVEVIELSEVQGATAAAAWPNATTEDCTKLPATSPDYSAPQGGLVGSLAVINVPQGTFFEFEPKAIDGFRVQPEPPYTPVFLNQAGDDTASTVSASFNDHGSIVTATYPKSRAIDAVSALFMADTVMGDVDETAAIGANTDWVLTFPTKQYYVYPPSNPDGTNFAPFQGYFTSAGSPVTSQLSLYKRDGSDAIQACGFNECPPVYLPNILYQTQVLSFGSQPPAASAVLGSALTTSGPDLGEPVSGELAFSNALGASNEGIVLSGVPVFGVQAINYVNSNVVAGVLSNYSGTTQLHTKASCTKNGAACQ